MKVVLSEFPRYTQHVRWLPCEDVSVLTEELDEHAFVCGARVLANDDLLPGVARNEVDVHCIFGRLERRRRAKIPSRTLEEGVLEPVDVEHHLLQLLLGDDGICLLVVVVLAFDRLVGVAENIDDAIWTQYLHPVLCVTGAGHEFGEGGSPEDAMVWALKADHLEADLLLAKVVLHAECHVQDD
jgi:hypothetical protein